MGDVDLGKHYSQDQIRQIEHRKMICQGCEHVNGVQQLSVGCKRCGCSGVNLLNGNCPAGKWQTENGQKLLLYNYHSPGDILVMTAAVRDLHRAHPEKFQIAVSTPLDSIWQNNPHITRFEHTSAIRRQNDKDFRYPIPKDESIQCVHCSVPLIQSSNALPYHYLQAMTKCLEDGLGVPIPSTNFHGDIHLSDEERGWMSQVKQEIGWDGPFWIMVAGGKIDITCKWWPPGFYQEVIDHFIGRIQFVQCGLKRDWHTRLKNSIDLVGKTTTRQFIRLMYHAAGVVCPITFAMHLAAAVPTKDGSYRPCVVIAGGREPVHWEQYPGHQFLHTVGMLDCCDRGGCWKNRCCKVGDGDDKDEKDLCSKPVPINSRLQVPKCMAMITPKMVISAIEGYLERGK